MSNPVLLKIVSGEEIVAYAIDESTHHLTLSDPYVFMYGTDDEGSIGIKLMDFVHHAEEKVFTIDKKHVIYYTYRVKKKLIEHLEATIKSNSKSISEILEETLSKLKAKTVH